MKKVKQKSQHIILIFLLLLNSLFSFIFLIDHQVNLYNYNKHSDKELTVKNSKISDIIFIDNNWTDAKAAGICTGEGTYSNPYVIEDLIINAEGFDFGIYIQYSNDYFILENNTIFNSGADNWWMWWGAEFI